LGRGSSASARSVRRNTKRQQHTLWSQKLINTIAAVISAGSVMAYVYDNLNSRSRGKEIEAYIKVVLSVVKPESVFEIPEKRGHLLPSQPKLD
jgi:hypothetical protein